MTIKLRNISPALRPGTHLSTVGVVLVLAGAVVAPVSAGPVSALVAASYTDLPSALALYRGTVEEDALEATALASVQLDAPPSLVAEVVARAHERGLTGAELLVLLQRTERLTEQELPIAPVLSRYLEGMAKGVPYPRIEAVAGSMEGFLVEAGAQFDASYPDPFSEEARRARLTGIDHAAYVLGLGVTSEYLQEPLQLALETPDPYLASQAPLLTLGILLGSGIAPETSAELVSLAWSHGYQGESMERLGLGLGRAGGDPVVVEEVLEMISSGAAQQRVFEGLDELVDRNLGLRAPGLNPGEDPGTRRGRTPGDEIRNKVIIGEDRPMPGDAIP